MQTSGFLAFRRFDASLTRFILCGALAISLIACDGKSKNKTASPVESNSQPIGEAQKIPLSPKEKSAQAAVEKAKAGPVPTDAEMKALLAVLPDDKELAKVVNPGNRPPYEGKTGRVVGVIRAAGDPAPYNRQALLAMKSDCDLSRKMFGRLFREGEGRTLADVLVAVTGYDGYIPFKDKKVEVTAKGCAWNSRTIALSYGQYLSISGEDRRAYVPELMGQKMPAQLFILPSAPPVVLPPARPGRFALVDSLRLYNLAEVYVLPYSTTDVTELDGRFEIDGLPLGKMKLNAFLPSTGKVTEREIEIRAGETLELDLELDYKAPPDADMGDTPGKVP
ncbi:MAG: carboxypeptidase-like regulatory domain-containing protein [Polyangiaceae bacterium]|nr:carboxypeptidase-like regulatory domain-containing protein [Polyangiaceae bacterium]